MSERDKIAARIRALLAKTTENGATEGEALAAAEMAARLLEKYNLTVDEVQLRQNPFAKETWRGEGAVADRLWKVADAIAYLTETTYWSNRAGEQPRVTFFGLDHEVAVAGYLLAICRRAMEAERDILNERFRILNEARRRREIIPYLDGMADRLRMRIREMKPQAPTGTGLILLKKQLVTQELERLNIKIESRKRPGSRRDDPYDDGWNAGGRVALNQGLETPSGDPLRLR